MIHLHRLRLTGPRRPYEVDFDARDDNVAIIAGPIHTGKTTILQMVDYLLGDDEHPTHPELARSVRSAALEFTARGERWTIERPLFSVEQVAYLRPGGLDDHGPLQRKIIDPPGDEDALSAWLLDAIGLHGLRLRVTEDNPNSSAHVLSFRDVMWVTFLPSKRLDNEALLHEGHDQKQYKLRQVIEMLFDVHDDRLAQLLDQQKRLRDERRDALQEVANLEAFLAEEKLPVRDIARGRLDAVTEHVAELDTKIDEISRRAAATTEFANTLRAQYSTARAASARAAARLRDRQSLLERLLPLRGQYAEDQRKLAFYTEATRLFDPLHIRHCPACLERLPASPVIQDGHCTLCGQAPEYDPSGLDRKRERRALTARIRDLDTYTQRVNDQLRDAEILLTELQQRESELAADLDARTASQLSPFVAERETLLRNRARLVGEQGNLLRALRWYDALERRKTHVGQLNATLVDVREQLERLRNEQPNRESLVRELSERFAALLVAWGFPKVDDPESPYLDDKFVPQVRGRGYRGIGSDGALTLIALAWMLTIFETAIEHGAPHPRLPHDR